MVTDFTYDGHSLSEFDCCIVSFDGGVKGEIDTDSQYSHNHISVMRGKSQPFITSVYEDPLVMEFYIAKDICEYDGSNPSFMSISVSEMETLKKWLVRPTPHVLTVTGDGYTGIYWNGKFNLEEYVFGDKRIGAHLTFECDAPFGYKQDVTFTGELEAGESFEFVSASDEIGWLLPTLSITLGADGDLELTNTSDARTTKVDNCVNGETITFSKRMQISTDEATHDVADDFNYVFYRVNTAFATTTNSIESNLPITYTLTYSPIAKVVIV